MECPIDQLTAQGFDMQFGVNVIGRACCVLHFQCLTRDLSIVGHWYLTELLMPALLAVAQEEPSQKARVITTSSLASYIDTIHWDTLKDTPQRRKVALDGLYNRSKHVCCDPHHPET